MTLGQQHVFIEVDLTPDELVAAGYNRNMYMPEYRLVCSCGFKSSQISQGGGEWDTRNTIRILHLLENMPAYIPAEGLGY